MSLCNLCVLCVSVVVIPANLLTTETQRTQRLHREFNHLFEEKAEENAISASSIGNWKSTIALLVLVYVHVFSVDDVVISCAA